MFDEREKRSEPNISHHTHQWIYLVTKGAAEAAADLTIII